MMDRAFEAAGGASDRPVVIEDEEFPANDLESWDAAHVELFFWLVAAWVKSRAERPSVSVVNRQLHVQIGCKLGIRNRKDELEASKAKQITN